MNKVYLFVALNFLLVIAMVFFTIYTYHMKDVNCQTILNSTYNVATEDVSACYKFYNFPIFWIIIVSFFNIIMIVVLNILIFLIKEMIEMETF